MNDDGCVGDNAEQDYDIERPKLNLKVYLSLNVQMFLVGVPNFASDPCLM